MLLKGIILLLFFIFTIDNTIQLVKCEKGKQKVLSLDRVLNAITYMDNLKNPPKQVINFKNILTDKIDRALNRRCTACFQV